MKANRTVAKFFAGLLMISAVVAGSTAPAQAKPSGTDGKPTTTSFFRFSDTGWD